MNENRFDGEQQRENEARNKKSIKKTKKTYYVYFFVKKTKTSGIPCVLLVDCCCCRVTHTLRSQNDIECMGGCHKMTWPIGWAFFCRTQSITMCRMCECVNVLNTHAECRRKINVVFIVSASGLRRSSHSLCMWVFLCVCSFCPVFQSHSDDCLISWMHWQTNVRTNDDFLRLFN